VENGNSIDLGKKVFFLYPPSVVRAEFVAQLLEHEFEIYLLRDHSAAKRILRANPDSIMFVNIDEGMPEEQWRTWIKEVMADEATAGTGIGILSYNNDEELVRTYLMEIGVRCGYVKLKLGAEASLKILTATLQANEAKGRRKYIRANCANDQLALLNIRHENGSCSGRMRDISVAGFSCVLDPDPNFMKNIKVDDIQLKLRGVLLKVEGIVFGFRKEADQVVYVFLFTNRLDDIGRDKIRKYIQIALQAEVDLLAQTA